MGQPTTPLDRVEPGAHPAIVDRIIGEMTGMANLVDNADAVTFAADEPWTALHRLIESLEKMSDEAGLHRPTTALIGP